ncbi:MAG TPA: MarR family transcriptional regulator [Lachnospiraceae bacterium]|nr:MarR family transcriptional regulator [Lachnospiraceae bacterium]
MKEPQQFREDIRILERKLELLRKSSDNCSCKAVTLPQCHALVEIGRAKNISLKELAAILLIDISTTSRTVDGLVKKNYVERTASAVDRRSIDIRLTDCGYRLFQDIEDEMNYQFDKIFSRIPKDEQANVLRTLDIILGAFSKE